MTEKKSTPTRRRASTEKRTALAPHHHYARTVIEAFFNPDTPDFITDMLGEWMTELENETQVHYGNSRAVCEVWLPLALARAEEMGLDYGGKDSDFIRGIYRALVETKKLYEEAGYIKTERTPAPRKGKAKGAKR